MSESYKKFIKTLQNIFEMEKADLDFGIYRIMNQKRDEINQFLYEDLLPQVNHAFADFADDNRKLMQDELNKLIKTLIEAGIDPETSIKVMELKNQLSNCIDIIALENEVFSKLQTFFSRYYDNGDFISQRRYKANTYAIPYEGEEVKLYWANNDQYYIKSSEYLRDYAFIAKDGQNSDKTFRIKLVKADTEKDNTKSKSNEERRFVLDENIPLTVENGELLIHFNYLPVGKIEQKTLNKNAVNILFQQEGKEFTEWLHILKQPTPTDKNKDRTLLEKHINDYTARNTFDYFIHKNLGDFLRRELDFYIKNEVLHLDDIDESSFNVTEIQLRKIKIMRSIAHKVIRMLTQVEEFQKKLWLKKKFVIETNYCITIDQIPRVLIPEVLANEQQIQDWVEHFAIDRNKLYENLKSRDINDNLNQPEYQYLLIDTKFFNQDFKDRLLSFIDNIDDKCQGLLIYSENQQALNFLENKYNNSIDCIHIDPPYNTETSGFLYKNQFKSSSWLSMMSDRLNKSAKLLKENGIYFCHIDDNEYENLSILFNSLNLDNQGTIIWDKRTPAPGSTMIARQHEYVICQSKGRVKLKLKKDNAEKIQEKCGELLHKFNGVNEESRNEFKKWIKAQDTFSGGEKSYCLIDNDGRVFQSVHLGASEQRTDPKYFIPLIHPVTHKACPVPGRGWTGEPDFMNYILNNNEIIFGKDETTQPRRKYYLDEGMEAELTTVIQSAEKGKPILDSMKLEFPYAHPINFYNKINWIGMKSNKSILLDFFAGSGTNGHSVINLNREDSMIRYYILIEMGEHFNYTLLPRIKKSIYSSGWCDGIPNEPIIGISHFLKYIKLESYEDTLNNLRITQDNQRATLLDMNDYFREDYMLGYFLDIETSNSPSLLNIDQFEDPFNYKLNIATTSVGVTKPTIIDLVETFNYLIGLKVKTIDIIRGIKIITGTNPKDETVLVVWRKIEEQNNAVLEEFLDKQGYNPRDTEFQHIYVNGDHTLEDPHSKVKMIEIEFKRLMFDVKDI